MVSPPGVRRTRIKICGLVDPIDIDAAVAIGTDAIGFVLWPRSPRAVTVDDVAVLRRRLPSWVSAVGLFVNAAPGEVAAAVRIAGLDVVQFHGDEPPADCAACDVPWWRAVRMRGVGDALESARRFPGAEALVLDAYTDGYGGSGRSFDWSWAAADVGLPRLLSGGLHPANVHEAILRVRPHGVDVSSGVQVDGTPRRKDATRIERFVAEVIAADATVAQAAATTRAAAPHTTDR